MARDSKTAAEARFKSLRANGGAASAAAAENEIQAAEARTAQLRSERLARDAETVTKARAKPAKKKAVRRGVGSY